MPIAEPKSGKIFKINNPKTTIAASIESTSRLVLDTNIWLDWLVFHNAEIDVLKTMVESGKARIFIDEPCEQELARVLAYPRRNETLSPIEQATHLEECRRVSQQIKSKDGSLRLPVCRDPDDQKFLELARDCAATHLVTRDKALLELARRKSLATPFRIVTPLQFNDLLDVPQRQ